MTALFLPAPSLIGPLPPLRLQLGENFSHDIPPYAFLEAGAPVAISASLSEGRPLPAWLWFDPDSRTLSGTPPLPGLLTLSFTATAADGTAVLPSLLCRIPSGPSFSAPSTALAMRGMWRWWATTPSSRHRMG
ncbi:MAG: putative Ig domain-containing protein [Synechococcaceae cyanobacterium]|nr:putative Ig domain-containing protein [Synechococcaceae cyanobacterium]